MDSASSNDDDEPKICTVFSSDVKSTKTIFDTIAFTSPKKEEKGFPSSETSSSSITASSVSINAQIPPSGTIKDTEQKADQESFLPDFAHGDDVGEKSKATGEINPDIIKSSENAETFVGADALSGQLGKLKLEETKLDSTELMPGAAENSPLPSANVLFADAPEVPFPVGLGAFDGAIDNKPSLSATCQNIQPISINSVTDSFTASMYCTHDPACDAWIPSDATRKILFTITSGPTTSDYIPERSAITMPGIVHEVEMVDKVAINMARIFGEAEASRRRTLTADNVTQDDNGLRELIKLGCYRSAINLTKRLLTLYGQGPGKVDQYSRHTPHSLQLWYTRIALLVRIREFSLADEEIKAFKDFENPDMYYEYYQELCSQGKKGAMVPFHFRLLAAEIPQYMRRTTETLDKLTHILNVVQQIIDNVTQGVCEDGNRICLDEDRQKASFQIWSKREIRVLYSLANAAIFCKDFNGSLLYLSMLLEKDQEHKMQITSSIGRLYLQFGDIVSAERYFKLAAELCDKNSDQDRVESLVDFGLLAIGQNNYSEAFNIFKQATAMQPENYLLTNNMAVCLVYLGKVKDALALMESTVKQNTPQLLQENVILNLSTIYELENSDGSKKNSLLKLISEYKGDGINLASLKMPNLV